MTTITTSLPHGLRRGDVLTTNRGDVLVVRKADPYSIIATSPRWYERLRWWFVGQLRALKVWWEWKRMERKLRRGSSR